MKSAVVILVANLWIHSTQAFIPLCSLTTSRTSSKRPVTEYSDFDDFVGDDQDDSLLFSDLFEAQAKTTDDLSGCQSRQFLLGGDMMLTDFAGSMGFDEVTDWEYYQEDSDENRKAVQPNPLDPAQPKRTRESSGSVVRIFRGEFVGRLAGTLRSKGLDPRVLIKEFTGKLALELAKAEMTAIGKLQSEMVSSISQFAKDGEWQKQAASRSANMQRDDQHVCDIVKQLGKTPFLGILGEVNLAELEDEMDPNEFYRALGVREPKPGAVWIVYEYAGLTSLQIYCQPAEIRRSQIPPKRGFFGVQPPPAVPSWTDRARYVRDIMKQSLKAVALAHQSGVSHRSIGRSSLLMGTSGQNKMEASSVYTVSPTQLVMKLADFGFSGLFELATYDKEFVQRAKTCGLSFSEGKLTEEVKEFCQAEDLHALGLVFTALLLTSLAEVDGPTSKIPATDEDTLQRLMTDIFEKDILQFREYVDAEDMWDKVVDMLDAMRGWELLSNLCFARESVQDGRMKTAEELLDSTFFQS